MEVGKALLIFLRYTSVAIALTLFIVGLLLEHDIMISVSGIILIGNLIYPKIKKYGAGLILKSKGLDVKGMNDFMKNFSGSKDNNDDIKGYR